MYKAILASMLTVALVASTPARAEDEKLKAPEGYEFTGKVKNSVRVRSIRSTKAVDDYVILFFMQNKKKIFANIMENRCAGLKREDRFSYQVHVGQLSDLDVITVFDNFGVRNHCGLGKFYEVVKVEGDQTPKE